jgi:hypothetical protein
VEGVFTAGFAISTVFLCGVSLVICGDFVVETWWLGARFLVVIFFFFFEVYFWTYDGFMELV